MSVNPTISAIRYGYGFAPNEAPPASVSDLLAQLTLPQELRVGVGFSTQATLDFFNKFRAAKRAAKKNKALRPAAMMMRAETQDVKSSILQSHVIAMITPNMGFYERLVGFWVNHFAVSARKSLLQSMLVGCFVQEAIRKNVTTSFPKMLQDVVTHPSMIDFLDQTTSYGPNSPIGRRNNGGINENLARELLELHTLGVDGAYTQRDILQLAELLTGLSFGRRGGTFFSRKFAEPGAERVLGQSYGGGREHIDNIFAFLNDVATHPDTAKHIARKLVIHFVSETPDEGHVNHVASVFKKTNGEFIALYEALLEHPNAWTPLGQKVKQPIDFVASGLRAFGVVGPQIETMDRKKIHQIIGVPLALMGQRFLSPLSAEGWPENADYWITPQGLAGRIQWANLAVQMFGKGLDPRDFVNTALRDFAGQDVSDAAHRAQVRSEGLALVLASPEFNKR